MPRHAGPRPRVTGGRLALVVVALACVVAAVVGIVRLDHGRSETAAPPASPASPAVPAGDPAGPVPPAAGGAVERAVVIGVADAVTLDVRLPDGRDVVRVRALGIQGPGSCYAGESTAFARRVLGGQAVDLVADGPATGPAPRGEPSGTTAAPSRGAPPGEPGGAAAVDRFDRRLQRVVLDGGRDYAVLAAEAGIARTYSVGAAPTTMPPVRDAEARARVAGRGVWGPPCDGRDED